MSQHEIKTSKVCLAEEAGLQRIMNQVLVLCITKCLQCGGSIQENAIHAVWSLENNHLLGSPKRRQCKVHGLFMMTLLSPCNNLCDGMSNSDTGFLCLFLGQTRGNAYFQRRSRLPPLISNVGSKADREGLQSCDQDAICKALVSVSIYSEGTIVAEHHTSSTTSCSNWF